MDYPISRVVASLLYGKTRGRGVRERRSTICIVDLVGIRPCRRKDVKRVIGSLESRPVRVGISQPTTSESITHQRQAGFVRGGLKRPLAQSFRYLFACCVNSTATSRCFDVPWAVPHRLPTLLSCPAALARSLSWKGQADRSARAHRGVNQVLSSPAFWVFFRQRRRLGPVSHGAGNYGRRLRGGVPQRAIVAMGIDRRGFALAVSE